jgi:hypothetical protein
MAKSLRPSAGLPILGHVIGDEFEVVLRAAQGGAERRFRGCGAMATRRCCGICG